VRCPGLAPAGSGGLGGPVIRLDAVLAEQAAHPVHPLVLRDDGLDVYSCRPLLLQAQLVGTQLIFPVPQGCGGLQVFGVKRGFPLPLDLGELVDTGSGRASGSGRPAADLARCRAAETPEEGMTGGRGCAVTALLLARRRTESPAGVFKRCRLRDFPTVLGFKCRPIWGDFTRLGVRASALSNSVAGVITVTTRPGRGSAVELRDGSGAGWAGNRLTGSSWPCGAWWPRAEAAGGPGARGGLCLRIACGRRRGPGVRVRPCRRCRPAKTAAGAA
jgi:hypothetical protein